MPDNYAWLIQQLILDGVLKTSRIIAAFTKVKRRDFLPLRYRNEDYLDQPIPIGYGQTNSQPTTVAFMFELLQPKEGDKILDVGAGSAWTTALLAFIVGQRGRVIGLEIVLDLVRFGSENLAKYAFENATILRVGSGVGLKSEAPYDKILVSAAAEEIPRQLLDQLKVGGRLVLPVGNSIVCVDKVGESEYKKQEYPGFAFVPLK